MEPHRIHGLAIGIDDYPPGRVGEQTFPKLAGCVADAESVTQLLTEDLEVPKDQVRRLIAPRDSSGRPAEHPTYGNIVAELRRLKDRARPGDAVWIHYSGHGARLPTSAPEVKGLGTFDEAWVPADVAEPSGRYLLDLELGFLIEDLARRGLFVTLVLDCCHAAGLLRQGPDLPGARPRAHRIQDDAPSRPSVVAPPADLATSRRRFQPLSRRPAGYVMIAACRERELAWEYPSDPRKPHQKQGALTRLLVDEIRRYGTDLSYGRLFERLRGGLYDLLDGFQTPRLEGEAQRRLLGGEAEKSPRGFTVLSVADDRAVIATGACHGAAVGDRLALRPLRSDEFQSTTEPTVAGLRTEVELVEIRESEAVAHPLRGALASFLPGDRAFPLGRAAGVDIARLPPALAEGLLQIENPYFTWRRRPPSELQVRDVRGRLEICAASDEPLPHPAPSVPADDPEAPVQNLAQSLVQRLERIVRYRRLETLRGPDMDPAADRPVTFSVSLGRLADDFRPGRDEPKPISDLNGDKEISFGQWLALTIENTCRHPLEIAVLDFDPTWCVARIYPTPGTFLSLDPGGRLDLPLRSGPPAGRHRLKVFATLDPVQWTDFELPPGPLPGPPRRPPGSAAESDLFSILVPGFAAPDFKDPFRAHREAGLWAVRDVRLRVVACKGE